MRKHRGRRRKAGAGQGLKRAMTARVPALILLSITAATLPLSPPVVAGDDELAHGRYLVRQVSLCIDCHGEALTGGIGAHEPHGPAIAGLPGLTVEAVSAFLQTGLLNGATVPRPMPPYRMHADDAHAIAVYLKSLPPAPLPSPSNPSM
jgi:mono/diheme cytochrome c family protein